LRQCGPRTGERFVNGRIPQPQPSLEVTTAQADTLVERGVGPEGAPAVGLATEQYRLPERRYPRNMSLEVEPSDVDEDEADDRVGEGPRVELAHEAHAVIAV